MTSSVLDVKLSQQAEAEVCRKEMRSLLRAQERDAEEEESLFCCLPAKTGADPLCSKI